MITRRNCRLVALLAAATLNMLGSQARGDEPTTGRVVSCDFATRSLPPAFRPPDNFANGYKLFQVAGQYLPEEYTVKGVVLLGRSRVRLTDAASRTLYTGLDQVYRAITADPLFQNVRSALPYCLSNQRPTHGHYFAYYPGKLTPDTPTIIFLHGFGGNFHFYIYLLKEEFPGAVILAPSWDGSWRDGTAEYLDDMEKDVKRRTSHVVRRPYLMAISAGGPAGFRLYNAQPERFSCYVSLASIPPQATVPGLKTTLRTLMLNGKRDSGVPIGAVESIARELAGRLPDFRFRALDGDHFFMLLEREKTFRIIKSFMTKIAGAP
jgi:pimeloyl-ACP methyl ester carboxylesterase